MGRYVDASREPLAPWEDALLKDIRELDQGDRELVRRLVEALGRHGGVEHIVLETAPLTEQQSRR